MKLKKLINEKGYSIVEIADSLRITKYAVYAWLYGKSKPTEAVLLNLAAILETTPEAVLSTLPKSLLKINDEIEAKDMNGIVKTIQGNCIGVEFQYTIIGGNDLNGKGKKRQCLWIMESEIKKI